MNMMIIVAHVGPCMGPEIPYACFLYLWFDLLRKDMLIMNEANADDHHYGMEVKGPKVLFSNCMSSLFMSLLKLAWPSMLVFICHHNHTHFALFRSQTNDPKFLNLQILF